jgi:hypothetical protein
MRHREAPFSIRICVSIARGVLYSSVNLEIDYSECWNEYNFDGSEEMKTIFFCILVLKLKSKVTEPPDN